MPQRTIDEVIPRAVHELDLESKITLLTGDLILSCQARAGRGGRSPRGGSAFRRRGGDDDQ
jgi:hypothetical protein